MNLEEKMKQELCRELVIPDVVEEKLNEAYQQILSGRPQKEHTVKQSTKQINAEQTNVKHMNTSQTYAKQTHTRQKNPTKRVTGAFYWILRNRQAAAWAAVAAAAVIAVTAGSLLVGQPALARDLPIIGNLFKKIQDTRSRTDPKDNTAYGQIEHYSKKAEAPQNHTEGSSTKSGGDTDSDSAESQTATNGSSVDPGTIAEASGVEVMVSDVYFDGYDLYYTFSIRTEDDELNSSEFLTPLNFIEGDPLPFFASASINGTDVTSVFMQPRKSEDGSFVQLVRISMDSTGLTSADALEVSLDFNAVGGTRLEDIGTYDGAYREAMGHKTIRGSWKLAFQAAADPSGSRSLVGQPENQGFSIIKAAATPSNLHLTVRIPSGWDAGALVPQIFDSTGKKIDWEHISYAADVATGQSLLEVTANATEASEYVVKIINKTAGTDDELHVIAEIPFELQ